VLRHGGFLSLAIVELVSSGRRQCRIACLLIGLVSRFEKNYHAPIVTIVTPGETLRDYSCPLSYVDTLFFSGASSIVAIPASWQNDGLCSA
jgi:hypothetical protein